MSSKEDFLHLSLQFLHGSGLGPTSSKFRKIVSLGVLLPIALIVDFCVIYDYFHIQNDILEIAELMESTSSFGQVYLHQQFNRHYPYTHKIVAPRPKIRPRHTRKNHPENAPTTESILELRRFWRKLRLLSSSQNNFSHEGYKSHVDFEHNSGDFVVLFVCCRR